MKSERAPVALIRDYECRNCLPVGNRFGKNPVKISSEGLEALYADSWPGNIRKLLNAIQTSLILVEGLEIHLHDLPENMKSGDRTSLFQLHRCLLTLRELEQAYIRNMMKRFSGHRRRIAAVIGISERSL